MSQTYLATGAPKTIKSPLVLKSFIQYGRFVYYGILQYSYSVKVRTECAYIYVGSHDSLHKCTWVYVGIQLYMDVQLYMGVHGYT